MGILERISNTLNTCKMTIFLHNGQLIPGDEITLNRDNRAFYYGDGFFETIRLINGRGVHLTDHIDRMNRSFQFLQLDSPFQSDTAHLDDLLNTVARANHITAGGRARITFYRESGGYYTPNHNKCGYLLECYPLDENHFELNRKGLHLALYSQNVKPVQPLYSLKTMNSLLYVLAGIYARNNHCDDALILNEHENIIESTSSNLFIVKNETISTPGLDEGCIPGVMRRNMLKIIENRSPYALERGNIRQRDLMEADEIFLTNAIRGVQWVVAFKEKRYYNKVSAHLAELLNEHLPQNQ
jgi:branched-subunit amino acid aminotransferase/4-amino-4-deoxychorismate lyase